MKKIPRFSLLVLLLSGAVFAITNKTAPVTYSANAVLTAAQLNSSEDTSVAGRGEIIDTMDGAFSRFSDFESGDSTLSRLNADTVDVQVLIPDSIIGRPEVDSLDVTYLNVRDSLLVSKTKITIAEITTVDINGGAIDGAIIGAATPAAGSFTDIDANGSSTFNESGADKDFRVEGVGDANAFFVQGSDGNSGFGTAAPGAKVHVISNVGDDTDGIRIERTSATAGRYNLKVNSSGGLVINETAVGDRIVIAKTTGVVTVADLAATNDINVSGVLIADSVASTKISLGSATITATNLIASNDVTGDSLIGTTGIRTGNAVTAVDLIASNDITGDSLIGTTGIRTGNDVTAKGVHLTNSGVNDFITCTTGDATEIRVKLIDENGDFSTFSKSSSDAVGTAIAVNQSSEDLHLITDAGDIMFSTNDLYSDNDMVITAAGDVVVTNDIYTTDWTALDSTGAKIVGFSAVASANVYYKIVGDLVSVSYFIQGTSNATTTSFTLPDAVSASSPGTTTVLTYSYDNGATLTAPGSVVLSAGSAVVNVNATTGGGGDWTSSGTKISSGQFFYEK